MSDKGSSRVISVVSRQAGAVAGKSVAISMTIANCGIKTVTGATDWLKQPFAFTKKKPVSTASVVESVDAQEPTVNQIRTASVVKSVATQETGQKKAAKALIASLESELAAAQNNLKKAQSNAGETHSKLLSQLEDLRAEKETLASDLQQAKTNAHEAVARECDVKAQIEALESNINAAQNNFEMSPETEVDAEPQQFLDIDSDQPKENSSLKHIIEEQIPQIAVKTKIPVPAAVTAEDVQVGVFLKATDKIIFARALSDIACQDATVRIDAAQTMAGIHHDLSVRALSYQVASEPSPQVRQECIKALASLETVDALAAIKRALADEAASVRLAAVWGLYQLAGVENVPELVSMFGDEDEEVRRRTATCIGWLGRGEFAEKLSPLLKDDAASVRLATIEAMSNLRNKQVVPYLIEQLNDPDESVRRSSLEAIEKITSKKMCKAFPKTQKGVDCLIARWQEWWKEDILK